MLSDFFKPEERKRGQDLIEKDAVIVVSKSDSSIRAFIKTYKVSLSASDITGRKITAECSCTPWRNGTFCKHIWAVLVKLEGSDFLESKTEIEKARQAASAIHSIREQAAEKQADYRKQMYAKQKSRAQEMRRAKKGLTAVSTVSSLPKAVEEARAYFAQNGFPLDPLNLDELLSAKKLLSRVFHPDKGGTHDETVTLNAYFEVIEDYLK